MIKTGVIGVGYLGRFHAQKYQKLDSATLVGVFDVDKERVKSVSEELNVTGYFDIDDLLANVDAVSIAASTQKHYELAKYCLENGKHVLLEKPMTETIEQAENLIAIATKNKLKLQIGHLERFNAARLALDKYLKNPLFIESQRLAPFNPRGADVNVILDLMIHDIDLIHAMVDSPIKSIDAHGAPILTADIDIANARIVFENNTVANVTASRVSFKASRKTRIFQEKSYISIDYQNKEFAVFQKDTKYDNGIPQIQNEQHRFENADALLLEIESFIHAIINNEKPIVSGEDGLEALKTAKLITDSIYQNLKNKPCSLMDDVHAAIE